MYTHQRMLIRQLTSRTVQSAISLLEGQYREHRIDMRGARLRRAVTELLRTGFGTVFVAIDPAPVGIAVVTWTFSIERAGKVAWLEELYVAPERRSRGIGRALLARSVAAARKAGCVSIELEVVKGHDRAARLYARERFEKLPRSRWSRPL